MAAQLFEVNADRAQGKGRPDPPANRADIRQRRFTIVIDSFELGGAERQAIVLARELRARAAQAEVWALFDPPDGPASVLCESADIPWRALNLRWGERPLAQARCVAEVALALRRARPDVILPYTIGPNVLCSASWRVAGAASCVWNQRDDGLYRLSPRLERWAAGQASSFVSNSAQGAAFLASTLGVAPRCISIVPNGVELPPPLESRASWRSRLGIPAAAFVAGMLARLHHTKDHTTLLRAWQIVNRLIGDGPRPMLLLAGRRDDAAGSIDRAIVEMKLSDSVRVLGPVSDISGLLGACDLSVFSALREGLPNAVLEAMLAALPVVASDVPGVRDALGADAAQDLVPQGDADSLARRIVALARDQEGRASAGARNRARAVQNYGVQAMVDAMVTIALGAEAPGVARRR